MDPKKQRMIEESIKMFAEKGYHNTSIQEIADKSEVSKGAFYLHFHSKDELLVEIYKYYSDYILKKLENVQSKTADPLQHFTEQIAIFLEFFKEHKEYLMIHFRDNIDIGEKINDLIISIHKQSYGWIRNQLYHIYGDAIKPYQVDIAIQIDGLLSGYFKWIAIHNIPFSAELLASYLIEKIDLIIQSIINKQSAPIFTEEDLTQFTRTSTVQNIFTKLKSKMEEMLPAEKQSAKEAIHVLEEEWHKKDPKHIIIQSMLDHLAKYPALTADIENLKKQK